MAHRDYTSNGSVQVMLFKDRLEICNPGSLPYGLTTAKLLLPHSSIPANPLLAEPMYLRGAIERMGTGTGDIVKRCIEMGLPSPVFIQQEEFRVIIYRNVADTPQETAQETQLVNPKILQLINCLGNEYLSSQNLMKRLHLKHRANFRENYLLPAIQQNYVLLLYPDNPTHRNQRYYLTEKGIKLLKQNTNYTN